MLENIPYDYPEFFLNALIKILKQDFFRYNTLTMTLLLSNLDLSRQQENHKRFGSNNQIQIFKLYKYQLS